MFNPFKTPEAPPKSPKPEKSQEELRATMEQRLQSFKPLIEEAMGEYERALKEGEFKDKEGEEEGQGEKRKIAMQNKLSSLVDRAEKIEKRLDSKEPLPQTQEEIQADYSHTDPNTKKVDKQEQITLNIETKLQSFISFYKSHNIDTPPNFEDSIREIWNTNYDEIQREIETHGFNEILIIPPTPNLSDLAEKMKMENGYYKWQNFKDNGSFAGVSSPNTDKPRIILVHNAQNLNDHPELKQTKNKTISNFNPNNLLSLEEYIIFQKKYYEEHQNKKHLDETTATWTSSKLGALFAGSYWDPDGRELDLRAFSSSDQYESLGARSARCFV